LWYGYGYWSFCSGVGLSLYNLTSISLAVWAIAQYYIQNTVDMNTYRALGYGEPLYMSALDCALGIDDDDVVPFDKLTPIMSSKAATRQLYRNL